MPVVKKEERYIAKNVKVVRIIKCNAAGKFSSELPPEVAKALNETTAYGNTLDECAGNWARMCKEWEAAKSESCKVILFVIETENKYSNDGLTFNIQCKAFVETKTTTEQGTKYTYDDFPSSFGTDGPYEDIDGVDSDTGIPYALAGRMSKPYRGDKAPNSVPYTPEAVKFFQDFAAAFDRLKEGLARMGKSPESMQAAISSGQLLLPSK